MLNAEFQIVMRGEDKEDRAAAQGRSFYAIFAMPCSPAMALKADIGADVTRGPSFPGKRHRVACCNANVPGHIIRRLRQLGRASWAELQA